MKMNKETYSSYLRVKVYNIENINPKHMKTNKLINTSLLAFLILMVVTNLHAQVAPPEALKLLQEGNERFVAGKTIRPRQDINRVKEVSAAQKPFAIIVGCSDSRVPNEIIFDQGVGDLFIVRTAGQVSTNASWGSIEFAEEVLGAKLIVVLGHTKCGAVAAAVNVPEVPGHIVTLINAIKPAATKVMGMPGDPVENAIRENVRMEVEELKQLEPVLAKRVREGKIKIVGGVYNLETGRVDWLPETMK
jgi:carbonic anhydrase